MSKDVKRALSLISLCIFSGCYSLAPQWQLRRAQLQTYQAHRQGQLYATELAQSQQFVTQLGMEKQQLEQAAAELQQNLTLANERINNLVAERTKIHTDYKTLLANLPAPSNPLGGGATRRFEELARKYPDFEFDPVTGVSKFNGELLFASGSDVIQSQGYQLLQEFTSIMNSGDAQQFNILVVGHTDDQPIVRPATKAKHPTNWDLSAHRATAVVKQLAKNGISEPRMGVAGYNKYQPVMPNSTDSTRQQNRRVEIFILARDASIAGREMSPIK